MRIWWPEVRVLSGALLEERWLSWSKALDSKSSRGVDSLPREFESHSLRWVSLFLCVAWRGRLVGLWRVPGKYVVERLASSNLALSAAVLNGGLGVL